MVSRAPSDDPRIEALNDLDHESVGEAVGVAIDGGLDVRTGPK